MKTITAKCSTTGQEILLNKGYFVAVIETGEWKFISNEAPETSGLYQVRIADIIKSPQAFVDWMAHLYEKSWFNADKFFRFLTTFRAENKLYGHL